MASTRSWLLPMGCRKPPCLLLLLRLANALRVDVSQLHLAAFRSQMDIAQWGAPESGPRSDVSDHQRLVRKLEWLLAYEAECTSARPLQRRIHRWGQKELRDRFPWARACCGGARVVAGAGGLGTPHYTHFTFTQCIRMHVARRVGVSMSGEGLRRAGLRDLCTRPCVLLGGRGRLLPGGAQQ